MARNTWLPFSEWSCVSAEEMEAEFLSASASSCWMFIIREWKHFWAPTELFWWSADNKVGRGDSRPISPTTDVNTVVSVWTRWANSGVGHAAFHACYLPEKHRSPPSPLPCLHASFPILHFMNVCLFVSPWKILITPRTGLANTPAELTRRHQTH